MKWSKIALGLVLTMMLVLLPNISVTRDNDVSASSSSGKIFEVYTDYQFLDGQYVLKSVNPDGSVSFTTLGPALRRESGNGSVRFQKNETVWGAIVVFDSGKTFHNALFYNVPEGGNVSFGVINPFKEELPSGILPSDYNRSRVETGNGGAASFSSGDSVVGFKILLADGSVRSGGVFIRRATQPGLVYDGVVNPDPNETMNVSEWTQ